VKSAAVTALSVPTLVLTENVALFTVGIVGKSETYDLVIEIFPKVALTLPSV